MPPEGDAAPTAARQLGHAVRAWRRAAGMSQVELGARLGMRQGNVARLESGSVSPSVEMLGRLARATGLVVTLRAGADWVDVALG
jgi:transcriptional regulator with XRE-family HTH domain